MSLTTDSEAGSLVKISNPISGVDQATHAQQHVKSMFIRFRKLSFCRFLFPSFGLSFKH